MALSAIVCSSVASPIVGKTPANSEVQFPVGYAPTELIVVTAAVYRRFRLTGLLDTG
jgi:hypothetical protein